MLDEGLYGRLHLLLHGRVSHPCLFRAMYHRLFESPIYRAAGLSEVRCLRDFEAQFTDLWIRFWARQPDQLTQFDETLRTFRPSKSDRSTVLPRFSLGPWPAEVFDQYSRMYWQ